MKYWRLFKIFSYTVAIVVIFTTTIGLFITAVIGIYNDIGWLGAGLLVVVIAILAGLLLEAHE